MRFRNLTVIVFSLTALVLLPGRVLAQNQKTQEESDFSFQRQTSDKERANLRSCEQNLADARRRADQREQAHLLKCVADSLLSLGDPERAIENYKTVLTLLGQEGQAIERAHTLGGLGLSLCLLSRFEEAIERLQLAEILAVQAGDLASGAQWAGYLGGAYLYTGRMDEAATAFRRAVDTAHSAGERPAQARWLNQLARTYLLSGRVDQAIAAYEQASSLVDERLQRARVLGNLGRLYGLVGKLSESEQQLHLALELIRGQGDERRRCEFAANLGALYVAKGDYKKGLSALDEARTAVAELQRSQLPEPK